MESKTKNRKTRNEVAKMVARAFDGMSLAEGDNAITELKDGWFNAAYNVRLADGREVILKIAPPQEAEVMQYEHSIMITEVATMKLVAQNPAIPVPEIFYFDTARDICDADYFFMEKVHGKNLEHVHESLTPDVLAKINQHIGSIIREINQFSGTYFGYDGNPDLRGDNWKDTFIKIMEAALIDGERKNADYFGYSADDIRAVIQKHASSLNAITSPVLVHWDAWKPNFFVTDDKVLGILDFERALWADPLMEAQFLEVTFGEITNSMKGYGKTKFTHEEITRRNLYTLHLALVMKVECYYRNYGTDDISNAAKGLLEAAMQWLQNN